MESIEAAYAKLREATDEIRAILRTDIPEFFVLRVKDHYLAAVEHSSALSAEAVTRLKRLTGVRGEETAAAIDAALASPEIWLDAVESPEDDRRSLDGFHSVSAELAVVGAAVIEILVDGGYTEPPEGWELEYRAPRRFVDGKYLPASVEHAWEAVKAVERARAEEAEAKRALTRAELLKRWDEG